MDRKSIIALVLCFVALLAFNRVVNHFYPPIPVSVPALDATTNAVTGTNRAVEVTAMSSAQAVGPSTTAESQIGSPAFVRPTTPEQLLILESPDALYHFTSHGGGLKEVELKRYPATVSRAKHANAPTNRLATLNAGAPVPIMALLGGAELQGDGEFTSTRIEGGVRMEKSLANGLRVVKEFRLRTNYVVNATLSFENTSSQPVQLPEQELVIGTSTPLGLTDESLFLGFQWYNGAKAETVGEFWFANRTLGCFPGTPRPRYEQGASNVFWGSVHNQFFAIAAIPSNTVPRIVGRRVDLPPPSAEELAQDSRNLKQPYGHQTSFLYPGTNLPAGGRIERQFDFYAGPKEYNTLARVHPNLNMDLIMQFGFFGLFAKALLLAMNGLYALGIPYGLVIVVITVIIRLLFWPLTTASTRSMKRMAALQPQMKAIQEKFKDDPKKMQLKIMEFMKEHKVSPLAGCLPMIIQIPVFIGFFTMLRSAIELRGARFLWAWDLSQTDTIFVIPGLGFIPFFGVANLGLPVNPLPLLMGGTQLWQAHLMPPSPGMDPVQQKIMRYMPLMLMVFFYNYSAGLSLYWTVGNLLSIAQMKLTKANDPKTQIGAAPPPRSWLKSR